MRHDETPRWGHYLTGLLAGATRPFRYRGAVYRLLGVPEEPERAFAFLPPLPMGTFRYEGAGRRRPELSSRAPVDELPEQQEQVRLDVPGVTMGPQGVHPGLPHSALARAPEKTRGGKGQPENPWPESQAVGGRPGRTIEEGADPWARSSGREEAKSAVLGTGGEDVVRRRSASDVGSAGVPPAADAGGTPALPARRPQGSHPGLPRAALDRAPEGTRGGKGQPENPWSQAEDAGGLSGPAIEERADPWARSSGREEPGRAVRGTGGEDVVRRRPQGSHPGLPRAALGRAPEGTRGGKGQPENPWPESQAVGGRPGRTIEEGADPWARSSGREEAKSAVRGTGGEDVVRRRPASDVGSAGGGIARDFNPRRTGLPCAAPDRAPEPAGRSDDGARAGLLAPGTPTDPGVERLRAVAREQKARELEPRHERETSRDLPAAPPAASAERRDPRPSMPAAIVRGPGAAARRPTSPALLTSSTMRSRHLRILR